MGTNRELHKKFRSGRARFYLADFHVHSPASADVRLSPRFDALSPEVKSILNVVPESLAGKPVQYEQEVITAYPPSNFFRSLVVQRDAMISGSDAAGSDDWAIIAVTDHNVCKYACNLASYAWANLDRQRIIILPGIELTVSYQVPPGTERAAAHILCIFTPNTTDSDIRIAIHDASKTNWNFGEELSLIIDLPSFIYALRLHPEFPAICIAAHVGSSSGVQSETKRAILSRLDAAISRAKGELETGEHPDTEELSNRLHQLEKERKETDLISLEILSLIGRCGFDALQVRGRHDEVHYRRLHRFKVNFGRAVPIVCSDAHRIEDVFKTETGIPHIKLSGLYATIGPSLVFNAIRDALRLGETRFSFVAPNSPLYWIAGIKIEPDASNAANFWPFEGNREKSFVLPLSRNLNCLIGGRGSGKSAALEALAFLGRPNDFEGFQGRYGEDLSKHEFYGRSKATIGGCKLTMCWQFVGYEQVQHLPKQAVFASRYFDPDGRHESVVYSNAEDTGLLLEQIPSHAIQYYRLGDIEKQTGPEKLRGLFDQICGKEIQEYEQKIQGLIQQLANQREEIVKLSQRIAELTKDGSPLREYAKRKRLFDEVNIPSIHQAYQEVDQTSAAGSVANKAMTDWSSLKDEIDITATSETISEFFQGVRDSCTDADGSIKPYHQELAKLSSDKPSEGEGIEATPPQRISDVIISLNDELGTVAKLLQDAKHNIASRGKIACDNLAAQGLPTGSKDRETKKTAFEAAAAALKDYQQLTKAWEELNSIRKNNVKELHEACQQRTNLRQKTAKSITSQLRRDLDSSVLIVEADAQSQMDTKAFSDWLDSHFSHQNFKYRKQRISALIESGLSPCALRHLLLQEGNTDHNLLQVNLTSAVEGNIDETQARFLLELCIARHRMDCELEESSVDPILWNELPEEISSGLISFPRQEKAKKLKVNDVLHLDEIIFDDIPEIRLNDRPNDPRSKPRPIENLSPGQRCSAILPILLLTGSSPLIIDQPEDNMDNRLIRQVIVNILSSIKLRRQVIFATHNPNLPVLGDVEQAIILQGVGENECQIKTFGDLDSSEVIHHLTEVMEGGREAFQYRQTVYQIHWPEPVHTTG